MPPRLDGWLGWRASAWAPATGACPGRTRRHCIWRRRGRTESFRPFWRPPVQQRKHQKRTPVRFTGALDCPHWWNFKSNL
jgi:hypothetical protein